MSDTENDEQEDRIIEKKSILGEGSYGKVYEVEAQVDGEIKTCALKANFCDLTITGTGNLRDIYFHYLLGEHPNIVKINSICEGDPFDKKTPMTPLDRKAKKTTKFDKFSFNMEIVGRDVEYVADECELDYTYIDKIICYMLLSIEYCHGKGVLHRDIKLSNVLIDGEEENIKICLTDFGLSTAPTRYRSMTPGVYTAFYRSPEICSNHKDYSYPADIWGLGSTIYECLATNYYPNANLNEDEEMFVENRKLLTVQINKMPNSMTKEEISLFFQKGGLKKDTRDKIFKKNNKVYGNFDLKKDISSALSKDGVDAYKDIKKFDELCDLLSKMLCFEPSKRPTATECLNHPYFSDFKDIIHETRLKFPPVKVYRVITIRDTIERKWACNVLIDVFNNHNKVIWFDVRILFHSLRVFDLYLENLIKNESHEKRDKEVQGSGRILICRDVEIVIWAIMYMFYKFFTILEHYISWLDFYKFGEEKLVSKKDKREARLENARVKKLADTFNKLENYLIKDVLEYIYIFEDTFLEMMDENYDDEIKEEDIVINTREAFRRYCHIKDFKGTMKELYEETILEL